MLYERTAISRKPDELIQMELSHLEQSNAVSEDFVFRDRYLNYTNTYSGSAPTP